MSTTMAIATITMPRTLTRTAARGPSIICNFKEVLDGVQRFVDEERIDPFSTGLCSVFGTDKY